MYVGNYINFWYFWYISGLLRKFDIFEHNGTQHVLMYDHHVFVFPLRLRHRLNMVFEHSNSNFWRRKAKVKISHWVPSLACTANDLSIRSFGRSMDTLREQCNKERNIKHLMKKLATCTEHVQSRTKTSETCAEELSDYIVGLEKCVLKRKLFSYLK